MGYTFQVDEYQLKYKSRASREHRFETFKREMRALADSEGWCTLPPVSAIDNAKNMEELLGALYWGAYPHEDNPLELELQPPEKLHSWYSTMWQLLAPCIRNGSFIACTGEDHMRWRWYFNGRDCLEQTAEVTWR